MPGSRSRRGGVRTGTPGTAYGERTDLNNVRVLPVQVPTGLQYGQRKQLEDSQHAVPVTVPSTVTATPAPAAPRPAPVITPIHAPSQRPGEPITAGLSGGTGPGPEALGLAAGQPGRLADVIATAAASSGSADLVFLADRARTLGQ